MSKPNDKPQLPAEEEEVDMERIKEMMGPFPYESNEPIPPKKKGAKTSLSSAAEEANAVLKSLSPDMGKSSIQKVDEDPVLDAEGNMTAPMTTLEPAKPVPAAEPAETETSETPLPEAVPDDPVIEKAVDEIVAAEGDAVLMAEDERLQSEVESEQPKRKGKLRAWIRDLWQRPGGRWLILGIISAVLLALVVVPWTRYFILNNVGIRSSLRMRVVDGGTLQPLKNVEVKIGNVVAQTDSSGMAKLEHLKLGPASMMIEKRAFAPVSKKITIGWGSNPQDETRLTAIGTQYTLFITDFQSGKPIEKAEASSGEGNAVSDKEGKLVLTLDKEASLSAKEISVIISASNYRTDEILIAAGLQAGQPVKLVPGTKHTYVDKRSGKYGIYTVYADGKNEKQVVKGTGVERGDIALLPLQNTSTVAYAATRENVKNQDGFLLTTLYILDNKEENLSKIDQSEEIRLLGWTANQRLIYIKVAAGASAANPKRQRLMSYSLSTGENKELASSNYFNETVVTGNKVLYARSEKGAYSINADGSEALTITNKQVWSMFRTDYHTLNLNASKTFYDYKLNSASPSLSLAKQSSVNRFYVDNHQGGFSLWIDDSGDKTALKAYDKTAKKDTTLADQDGLNYPVYWLDGKHAIYRVDDGAETADYVVNIEGGEARKITEVFNSRGPGN